ncbi:MAG: contractile injection system tape measure protein, partial [Anaerolineae bacterium]
MSAQRHIIKRQTIELKIQKAAEAQSLQAEMSRIYRQRIVPLIDKYCTELSQPNHIHRIELLEVDLGYLDPQHFEEQLVAKVGPAVRQALAAQIDRQEQSALQPGSSFKAMSHLELFAFFARTGSLPWWADTSQPRLLDECLQHLLQTAPEPLRRLLRSLIQEQRPLRRLIYHYSDELLAQLAGLLTPSLQPSLARELPELMIGFKKIDAIASKPAAHLRQSVWANILYVAGLTGGQPETPES